MEKQVPLFEDPNVGLVYSNTYFMRKINANWKEFLRYTEPQPEGDIFDKLIMDYNISFDTAIFRKAAIGTESN